MSTFAYHGRKRREEQVTGAYADLFSLSPRRECHPVTSKTRWEVTFSRTGGSKLCHKIIRIFIGKKLMSRCVKCSRALTAQTARFLAVVGVLVKATVCAFAFSCNLLAFSALVKTHTWFWASKAMISFTGIPLVGTVFNTLRAYLASLRTT